MPQQFSSEFSVFHTNKYRNQGPTNIVGLELADVQLTCPNGSCGGAIHYAKIVLGFSCLDSANVGYLARRLFSTMDHKVYPTDQFCPECGIVVHLLDSTVTYIRKEADSWHEEYVRESGHITFEEAVARSQKTR